MSRHSILAAIGLSIVAGPLVAGAATEDDFYVRNTQDLVDLCTVKEGDPVAEEAVHFCHGFLSGAWQYHEAQANGPKGVRLVCPPNPPPTRDEVLEGFVVWAQAPERAQYLSEPAVETLFRYLIERSPCPRAAAPAAPMKEGKK